MSAERAVARGFGDARPGVDARSVALPVEHGGWGFLLEPALLGLAVAPSWAGAFLGVAALGAFLARQPLKLLLADRRRGARYPRTAVAERFALLYGAVALGSVALAVAGGGHALWIPIAAAAPLGLVQLGYDARNRSRELPAELAGATALGSVAACVALAGGWPLGTALVLWLLVGARGVGSVLFIRARLRLDRGASPHLAPTWAAHLVSLAIAALLLAAGQAPRLALVAFALLTARAAYGLSRWRRAARPQAVGLREMGFGFVTVALLALGYRLGW